MMAGVLFVVCVPTAEYEEEISNRGKNPNDLATCKRTICTSTPADGHESKVNTQDFIAAEILDPTNTAMGPTTEADPVASNESVVLIQDELCGNDDCCDAEDSDVSTLLNVGLWEHLDGKLLGGAEALRRSWEGLRELVAKKGRRRLLTEKEDEVKVEVTVPLEKVLRELLSNMGVDNAVWCDGKGGRYYQVLFSIESGVACEQTLQAFADCGIGLRLNSVVSVIPCALHYHGPGANEAAHPSEDQREQQVPPKCSAWDRFVQSVRARLTVAQVVESVKAEAAWTFDFMLLLIIAAFLAALGLVEDSTVFLVSSMLISPLMGPIIAGTFGTCIQDRGLMRLGVVNEMLGILLTMFIGFLFGLVICMIDDRYGIGEWPTNEMLSKCEIRSLWVGALIAFPSGAAGAIAVLGDNTGSLVGVAISASLLPPAVNAGLVWAMSFSYLLWQNNSTKFNTIVDTQRYSSNQAVELAVMGAISLCLTLVNVICIYAAGILVLKVKEVVPLRSKSARHFWSHDVRIARDYNRTVRGEEARGLARGLSAAAAAAALPRTGAAAAAAAAATLHRASANSRFSDMYGLGMEQSRRRGCLVEHLNQLTWSPAASDAQYEKPTLQQLRSLYESLTGDRQPAATITSRPRKYNVPLIRSTSGSGITSNAYQSDEPNLLETIREMDSTTLVKSMSSAPLQSNGANHRGRTEVSVKTGDGCSRRKFVVTPAKDPLDNKCTDDAASRPTSDSSNIQN